MHSVDQTTAICVPRNVLANGFFLELPGFNKTSSTLSPATPPSHTCKITLAIIDGSWTWHNLRYQLHGCTIRTQTGLKKAEKHKTQSFNAMLDFPFSRGFLYDTCGAHQTLLPPVPQTHSVQ